MKKISWGNFLRKDYNKTFTIPGNSSINTGFSGIMLLFFHSRYSSGFGALIQTASNSDLELITKGFVPFDINNEVTGKALRIYSHTDGYIYVENQKDESRTISVDKIGL